MWRSLLWVGLLSGVALTQGEATGLLTRALRLEEAEGRVQDALKFYREVSQVSGVSDDARWQGVLGEVRCLVKLGESKQASDVLESRLKPLVMDRPERDREFAMWAARVEGISLPDEATVLEQAVDRFLASNDSVAIVAMGDRVIPILLGRVQSGSTRPLHPGPGASRPPQLSIVRAFEALMAFPPEKVVEALKSAPQPLGIGFAQQFLQFHGGTPEPNRWQEVVELLVAHPEPTVRGLLPRCLARLNGGRAESWLTLAADKSSDVRRSVAEFIFDATRLDDESVFRVADMFLGDSDREVRAAAVQRVGTLAVRNETRTQSLLLAALRDPHPDVRDLVFRGGGLNHENLRQALVSALDDSSSTVRVTALTLASKPEMVGAIVPEAALPRTLDDSGEVAEYALRVLNLYSVDRIFSVPNAEATLVRAAQFPDRRRERVIPLLSVGGSPAIASDLLPLIRSNSPLESWSGIYYAVRHDRVDALDAILARLPDLKGYARLWEVLVSQATVLDWLRTKRHADGILSLMADSPRYENLHAIVSMAGVLPPERRGEALSVISKLPAERAKELMKGMSQYLGGHPETLAWCLRNLEQPELAAPIVNQLAFYGRPEHVPALLAARRNLGNAAAPWMAAVGAHANASHVPLLVPLLTEGDGGSAGDAVRILSAIGGPEAYGALLGALERGEGPTSLILDQIQEKRLREAAPVVERLLAESRLSEGLRSQALLALGCTGDTAALPALVEAARQPGGLIKVDRFFEVSLDGTVIQNRRTVAAVAAIAELGPAAFYSAWGKLVGEGMPEATRVSAIEILPFVGTESLSDRLLGQMASPSPELRAAAARAAGEALELSVVERLRFLVRDPDVAVRAAATGALHRMATLGALPR